MSSTTEKETQDPFESKEYQQFVESLAQECRCAPCCQSTPCDGLLAGGPCDSMRCDCSQGFDADEEDREDYWDDWGSE